jgi:hypothetical protein
VIGIECLSADNITAPQEASDELRPRRIVHLLRRAQLFDPSRIHDRDQVGRCHGFALVVGDVDRGVAVSIVQAAHLEAHFLAQVCIKVGKRLVEQ